MVKHHNCWNLLDHSTHEVFHISTWMETNSRYAAHPFADVACTANVDLQKLFACRLQGKVAYSTALKEYDWTAFDDAIDIGTL